MSSTMYSAGVFIFTWGFPLPVVSTDGEVVVVVVVLVAVVVVVVVVAAVH